MFDWSREKQRVIIPAQIIETRTLIAETSLVDANVTTWSLEEATFSNRGLFTEDSSPKVIMTIPSFFTACADDEVHAGSVINQFIYKMFHLKMPCIEFMASVMRNLCIVQL